MTTTELRRRLKKSIDKLPTDALQSAADYMDYLASRETDLSADDRRKIAGMKKRIAKAERDIAAGRTRNWREIRSDV